MAFNSWFVVSKFSQWEGVGRDQVRIPSSIRHAKEMGSLSTACGLHCETWTKWWELAFSPYSRDCCEECVSVVQLRAHS